MWPLDDNSPPFRAAAGIGHAGVGSLGRMAIRVDLRKRLVGSLAERDAPLSDE
jgi:hypothetical protein